MNEFELKKFLNDIVSETKSAEMKASLSFFGVLARL
jgi:hypothetical protein